MGLILHVGARAVTPAELRALPVPGATATFHPVAHDVLFGALCEQAAEAGYGIRDSAHGILGKGDKYFGFVELSRVDAKAAHDALIVGLRNAHDGSSPVCLAFGKRVFVCDNFALSGELILKRKHTSGVLRDLPAIMGAGVRILELTADLNRERALAYRASRLSDGQVCATCHDLTARKVIAARTRLAVERETMDPRYVEHGAGNTAYALEQAVTESWKLTPGISRTLQRSERLYQILDNATNYRPSDARAAVKSALGEAASTVEVCIY